MSKAEDFACKYAGFEMPPTRRDHLQNRERCDIYSAVLEGYEQAEKDLGWISIKDRLPEKNKWVFVCVDMQGVPQCVGMAYLKNGVWCDDENDDGFCVEYWMDIPKIPEK